VAGRAGGAVRTRAPGCPGMSFRRGSGGRSRERRRRGQGRTRRPLLRATGKAWTTQ
jgi:hypothetical protein